MPPDFICWKNHLDLALIFNEPLVKPKLNYAAFCFLEHWLLNIRIEFLNERSEIVIVDVDASNVVPGLLNEREV